MTKKIDWHIPGHAKSTILLPHDHANATILFNIVPGSREESYVRGGVNTNALPDVVDVEHFDHIFKRLQKNSRIVHFELLHEAKSFDVVLAFSFFGGKATNSSAVKINTDASGITYGSVPVNLIK